jgi:hypothetical protein
MSEPRWYSTNGILHHKRWENGFQYNDILNYHIWTWACSEEEAVGLFYRSVSKSHPGKVFVAVAAYEAPTKPWTQEWQADSDSQLGL